MQEINKEMAEPGRLSNYNYLTIDESTASLLKMMMIGGFPLIFFVVGITVIVRRRRRQNE